MDEFGYLELLVCNDYVVWGTLWIWIISTGILLTLQHRLSLIDYLESGGLFGLPVFNDLQK